MNTQPPLPDELADAPSGVVEEAVEVRERRLTVLFRRWPKLTKEEDASLQGLYRERIHLARLLGRRRTRR
jgi:hypothetical protein